LLSYLGFAQFTLELNVAEVTDQLILDLGLPAQTIKII